MNTNTDTLTLTHTQHITHTTHSTHVAIRQVSCGSLNTLGEICGIFGGSSEIRADALPYVALSLAEAARATCFACVFFSYVCVCDFICIFLFVYLCLSCLYLSCLSVYLVCLSYLSVCLVCLICLSVLSFSLSCLVLSCLFLSCLSVYVITYQQAPSLSFSFTACLRQIAHLFRLFSEIPSGELLCEVLLFDSPRRLPSACDTWYTKGDKG